MLQWSALSWADDTRAFMQRRVATYILALTCFFAAFYLLDLVGVVADDRYDRLLERSSVVHIAVVGALLVVWLFVRRGERGLPLLIASDAAATWLVAGLAALTLVEHTAEGTNAGPAFGISLVLVVRAALVPSSARRTIGVGGVVAVALVWAYALAPAPSGLSREFVAAWMMFFIAASALVSRVIYGLHRRLREARALGQYVLEQRLGAGGMGVVYRARHSLLRRPTAVKLLLPQRGGERYLARFEREVRMTARLNHPNTITVYDFGRTPEGRFYYAMELLDGADLTEVVSLDGPQPAGRVVHVLAHIADALTEAHGIGLIHRDIKPSNIMLCTRGGVADTPKLLDFGLVQDVGEDPGESAVNAVLGTPLYLSPEAILDPDRVDGRSDLYALGAVGYYMLTGEHVFTGKNVADVCRKHVDVEPVRPSERLGRPLPDSLEAVVLTCLAKEPADRPATAAALRDQLRACSDVAPWGPEHTRAWWAEHEPALRQHRSDTQTISPERTIDIDLARS